MLCSTRLKFLLDDFAEEGEDEEREDGAPDERVEDHERPPEDTVGGGSEGVGNGVAGLAEEAALEEQEEDKVDDAERNVCEQEGFHFRRPFELRILYHFFVTQWLRGLQKICRRVVGFPLPQVGEEVHFQRIGQFRGSLERKVDVVREDLGYVRARDIHAPRELCLVDAQLLHPPQYSPQKNRSNSVNRLHSILRAKLRYKTIVHVSLL